MKKEQEKRRRIEDRTISMKTNAKPRPRPRYETTTITTLLHHDEK
jgi:hypothetical protein